MSKKRDPWGVTKPNPRQSQQEHILHLFSAYWNVGSSRTTFMDIMMEMATKIGCEVEQLTDDQIEEWLVEKHRYITDFCAGSCLNG